MPEEKKIIMSPEKIKALQEELDDIKMNRRKQNAQRLKEAKAQGDISENAEYIMPCWSTTSLRRARRS